MHAFLAGYCQPVRSRPAVTMGTHSLWLYVCTGSLQAVCACRFVHALLSCPSNSFLSSSSSQIGCSDRLPLVKKGTVPRLSQCSEYNELLGLYWFAKALHCYKFERLKPETNHLREAPQHVLLVIFRT
jgi:hypothetical protein